MTDNYRIVSDDELLSLQKLATLFSKEIRPGFRSNCVKFLTT